MNIDRLIEIKSNGFIDREEFRRLKIDVERDSQGYLSHDDDNNPFVAIDKAYSDDKNEIFVSIVYARLIDQDALNDAELDNAFDYTSPTLFVDDINVEISNKEHGVRVRAHMED